MSDAPQSSSPDRSDLRRDDALLSCPFCGGEEIELWTGFGTQAGIGCVSCGCERAVQVADMREDGEPYPEFDSKTFRYPAWLIERTNKHLISEWNTRAPLSGAIAQRPLAYRLDHPAIGIELSIFEPDADWISRGWTVTPLYASPAPSWQPSDVQKIAADAIRTFCKSLGSAAVQMSHGEERIYYAGISLDALSVAVALALTSTPRGTAADYCHAHQGPVQFEDGKCPLCAVPATEGK